MPFQPQANPVGQIIETPLVRRLRDLARDIAARADSTPRWIFLVGGPGNGKSETVQDFLSCLDASLGSGGILVEALRRAFSRPGLLPRKVEIQAGELGSAGPSFAANVGRLILIQDATATENALGNAAVELADDLADLLTYPSTDPVPVFVACANRGLLARAMNEAARSFGSSNEVTQLLATVIQASSVGPEMTGGRACWPLPGNNHFACWPLDMESLIGKEGAASPVDTVFRLATDEALWEVDGRCRDCSAHTLCPFRQSAEWLRSEASRQNLLALLRRGELARGQRWNFRDVFSLAAELLVGQWSDFEPADHPCAWIHQEYAGATTSPPEPQSVLALALRLYPHALFRGGHAREAAATYIEERGGSSSLPSLTNDLLAGIVNGTGETSTKPIREILARDYERLDPAASSPTDPSHLLRVLEDGFCQSIVQGRSASIQVVLSASEDLLLEALENAEAEWDLLGRESAVAVNAVCVLRMVAAMIAKRSAGVRLGHHALDKLLADYEAAIRDPAMLADIRAAIQPLLGTTGSNFNLLEIFGQPTGEKQPLVSLQGPPPGIRSVLAPVATPSSPGHDVPFIEFTEPTYRIPLTFEFFLALRLRREGCAGSSLPASVRAALDRVRHRFAGELCRNDELFVDGRAFIALATGQRITVPAQGLSPVVAAG